MTATHYHHKTKPIENRFAERAPGFLTGGPDTLGIDPDFEEFLGEID